MSALDIPAAPEVHGFRTAIEILRVVAEIAERHPDLPVPSVSFTHSDTKSSDWSNHVTYHLWDWGAKKEQRVVDRINTIVETFPESVRWIPQDPTNEPTVIGTKYFRLQGQWGHVQINIITDQANVGQQVDTIHSGPQVRESAGYISALRQTVHSWKPNPNLSPRIMNQAEALALSSSGSEMQELDVLDADDD
ncbi:hypothetical protein SEA_RIZWANA_79 [Arthrobacter phage Rizwana]|nr:hypothetical protein SEA_RIZWANA_79 [Arthrobacter phage Rizwana]